MVSSRKLSSEEVDALIEGLQSDDNGSSSSSEVSEAANVRPYKFGSDELSLLGDYYALRLVNERFARQARSVFLPMLRILPRISSFPPEVKTFDEYSSGIESFMSLTSNRLEELRGNMLLVMDPNFISILTNSYYGGQIEAIKEKRSEFTSTEERLIEIVSEPDIRSSDEAYQYLAEVRKLVRYLDICDGNLEEGSLRCDANISVMLKGSKTFGNRAEVKNMNSLRNVKRAIEHEMDRQFEILENGGVVEQQTRSFNANTGTTSLMRSKEDANDYRYFPEPDLQPVLVTEEYIETIKKSLPPLPKELFRKFTTEYGLSEYDTNVIIEEKDIALYFNELCQHTKNYKAAANFVNGSVKSYLNENAIEMSQFSISTKRLAQLIQLVDDGKVSNSVATQKIFGELIGNDISAEEIAKKNNWIQESNTDALQSFVEEAIAKYPEKVLEYKAGKKGLIGLFMGEVMKLSRGKADPKIANQLVREALEK